MELATTTEPSEANQITQIPPTTHTSFKLTSIEDNLDGSMLQNQSLGAPTTHATSAGNVKLDEGTIGVKPGGEVLSSQLNLDAVEGIVPRTPQVSLTFLLVSGMRKAMAFDPDISISRVKELVWMSWPTEWTEERPPAPSYLRILHGGKILQDDDCLSKLPFPTSRSSANTPMQSTIVHLSIRQFSLPVTDSSMKKLRRRGSESQGGPSSGGCCGCVII